MPGSILYNAQSPELRTYLAGQVRTHETCEHLYHRRENFLNLRTPVSTSQIARTCSIFSVDEIVVFHEPNHVGQDAQQTSSRHNAGRNVRGKYRQTDLDQSTDDDESDMDGLLVRVLGYLETPQCVSFSPLLPIYCSVLPALPNPFRD